MRRFLFYALGLSAVGRADNADVRGASMTRPLDPFDFTGRVAVVITGAGTGICRARRGCSPNGAPTSCWPGASASPWRKPPPWSRPGAQGHGVHRRQGRGGLRGAGGQGHGRPWRHRSTRSNNAGGNRAQEPDPMGSSRTSTT